LQGSPGETTIQRTIWHIYNDDLNKVLKAETQQEDGFKEARRWQGQAPRNAKKAALPMSSAKVATKNFFAPLRTTNMDTDAPGTESSATEETFPGKVSRPPPIVLTSAINLIQL
jgi:hypothetical protein